MKKISLYTLSLLLVGMISCTEDSEPAAPPQSWEQEASKPGVTFTTTSVAPINLADAEDGSLITLCSITAPAVESGSVSYEVKLDDKRICNLDENGQIVKDSLQKAVVELYGKRPSERTIKGVVTAFIDNAGQVTRKDANEIELKITPEAPYIESGYYLVGNMCGWSVEEALPFDHSGKDVYEDPIFSIIVETTGENYWKVVPKSNIDNNDLWAYGALGVAVNGSTDIEGKLITDDPQAAMIEDPGFVRITLDMMEYSYRVEPFDGSPFLYVPGNHQGWNPGNASYIFSTNMSDYQGFLNLDGEFKLTGKKSWGNPEYGDGGENTLVLNGGGNLSTGKGLYLLKASLSKMTWSTDLIETFGLIGNATPGDWGASTPMEFDEATLTFSVTADLIPGEFKFRANNDWAINLGGDLSNLTQDGNNMKITEAGTYKITLNLSDAAKYTATLVKQ